MQDQRHTDNYNDDDDNDGGDDDDDDDNGDGDDGNNDDDDDEDNDTPVYGVGVHNGLKHDSLLKAIVGLADRYININLHDFNDNLVDIAMIILTLSLRLLAP